MGVNTLSIEQRYYLGHYREGTVFSSVEDYLIDGTKVSVYVTKRYYCGRDEKGSNKFGFAHKDDSFELSEQDAVELEKILEQIKISPDTKYSADHYKKGVFDRRRFDYFAVAINGVHYELSKSDAEMAGGLMRILRVEEMLGKCSTGYEESKPEESVVEEKASAEEEKILLEQPEVHEPEKILAKNEDSEDEEPVKEIVIEMKEPEEEKPEVKEEPKEEAKPVHAFHRELLTKPNHASWNQVVGKY